MLREQKLRAVTLSCCNGTFQHTVVDEKHEQSSPVKKNIL